MKKIVALLTLLAMLFSYTAVSAANDNAEKLAELMNTQTANANVEGIIRITNDIPMLDLLGEDGLVIEALLNSSFEYEFDTIANDEMTKLQSSGGMVFNSGAKAYGIPTVGGDIWINLDLENTDNIKYYIIMQMVGDDFKDYLGEFADKYILMDYTKIPDFKELMSEFVNMGLFNRESLENAIKDEKVQQAIAALTKDINIDVKFANNKYSIVLGDKEVKAVIAQFFNNFVDYAATYAGESIDTKELSEMHKELTEELKPFAKLQLFDEKRGFVMEVSKDGRETHMEINLAMNLLDISKEFDPAGDYSDVAEKEFYDIKLSILADTKLTPLAANEKIYFPKLNGENSIDLFAYGSEITDDMINKALSSKEVIEIVYNGKKVEFENKPMILNDRTFVPFRALANMLGIEDEYIGYDEKTEKVSLKNGDIEIEMYIGSTVVYVNGEMQTLDVPAFTSKGRTYIPARFVSEMFGRKVDYKAANGVQTITID